MQLEKLEKPIKKELLICVYDISNFIQLAKSFQTEVELFLFLNELARIITPRVTAEDGAIIKYIGDSGLFVFPREQVDSAVMALYRLKRELEDFMKDRGFKNRFSFSLHFGQVVIGYLGKEPFRWLDIIGNAVQLAFVINGKPFKDRFVITPQVFRKLKPETRKIFHKYTPQIFYIAD